MATFDKSRGTSEKMKRVVFDSGTESVSDLASFAVAAGVPVRESFSDAVTDETSSALMSPESETTVTVTTGLGP